MTWSLDTSLLTLADIAGLAGVQRPVVTAWRSRPSLPPFPKAVERRDGVEYFSLASVVAYLVRADRGDEGSLARRAATFVRPPVPGRSGMHLVEALVAVRAMAHVDLTELDDEDLVELAWEVDPTDRLAASEIEASTSRERLDAAAYAEALLDASLGPSDALSSLARSPGRFGLRPDVAPLADEVLDFVGRLSRGLVAPLVGAGTCVLIDPEGCQADLLQAVTLDGERWPGTVAMPAARYGGDRWNKEVRSAWRSMAASGQEPRDLAAGALDPMTPAVHLLRLPNGARGRLDDDAILTRLDAVVLGLGLHQRLVAIAPASALADELSGAAARVRDDLLRTGRLRAVVRLGAGATPAVPQARWAIWVIGPALRNPVSRAHRTVTCDLTGLSLAAFGDALVADVVAAIEDRVPLDSSGSPLVLDGVARTFQVAQYVPTSRLLGSGGALVSRGAAAAVAVNAQRPVDVVTPDALADGLARVRVPLAGLALNAARPLAQVATVHRSIDELIAARRLRVLPGVRVSPDELDDAGAVWVIGADELSGEAPRGRRRVDLLTWQTTRGSARTEAGDVVFTTGARGAAWVDPVGGCVVESPARALRILPTDVSQRLVSEVVAADLRDVPRAGWRATRLRLVCAQAAAAVAPALAAARRAHDLAVARARDLDDLTHALTEGLAAGTLTATLDEEPLEGH